MDTAEHWDDCADAWDQWASTPGHDSYWTFHGRQFHRLIPGPFGSGTALDLACGEGRVARHVESLGWNVIASDYSRRLCWHTRRRGTESSAAASAERLPFRDATFDLITVFMAFHDFDEGVFDGAFGECARVLKSGGVLVAAINHPAHSFLEFERDGDHLNFRVKHGYFGEFAYENVINRSGLELRFRGVQRSIGRYLSGFLNAGFTLTDFVEVTVPPPDGSPERGSSDWGLIPMFFDVRVVKASGGG